MRRDWLEYDEEREHMFCENCRKYTTSDLHQKGPFVIGTANFKLESIKEHEKSQGHLQCTRIAAAKRVPPNSSPAEKALCSLHQAQKEKMDKLFRTAHAIAKKGRPFTDFVWMCELDERKGLKIGETYCNRAQARQFVSYIAEAERQKIHTDFS